MKGWEENLFWATRGGGKPWHGGFKGGGGGGGGGGGYAHWRPQRSPQDAHVESGGGKKVPSWNGDGSQLRKYIQEVRWFVMSVKEDERKYAVARLLPGLSGSARLAAINIRMPACNVLMKAARRPPHGRRRTALPPIRTRTPPLPVLPVLPVPPVLPVLPVPPPVAQASAHSALA